MGQHIRTSLAAAAVASAALVVAGCGAGGSSGGSTGSTSTSQSQPQSGTGSHATSIGTVLATSSGMTLYELVGATASAPACSGGCLAVWPQVESGGHPLVVGGHPVHTYVSDTAPGQVNGQGLHDQWGTWLALSPAGTPITASPAGTPATSHSGGGGYGYG